MFKKTQLRLEKNGLTLNCLLYLSEAPYVKYTVTVLHGFAGHKDSAAIEQMAEKLIEKDERSVILSFDLPGHASDTEALSLDLCDRYTTAAAMYLRERFEDAEPILYGTSFGGYLALKYISDHPNVFSKCILRCPAVRMFNTMKEKIISGNDLAALEEGRCIELGFDRKVQVCQLFLDSLEIHNIFNMDFRKFATDTLILQGTCDELVDCEDIKEFAKRNGLQLVLSEGADHRFLAGNTLLESIEACVKYICG